MTAESRLGFMVIGAPRSGTAWAANWLTDDRLLCLHDPLAKWLPEQLDSLFGSPTTGISCTAAAVAAPVWVHAHPARKIVLHRDFSEINASLEKLALSLPLLNAPTWERSLKAIDYRAIHVHWRDLFDPVAAAAIHRHLTGKSMNAVRHAQLVRYNVQLTRDAITEMTSRNPWKRITTKEERP